MVGPYYSASILVGRASLPRTCYLLVDKNIIVDKLIK